MFVRKDIDSRKIFGNTEVVADPIRGAYLIIENTDEGRRFFEHYDGSIMAFEDESFAIGVARISQLPEVIAWVSE